METKKVSLFILGAAKCGTTTLHFYLNQHPAIQMASPKEPLFFEAEYELGNRFYLEKYFGNRTTASVLGEARHRNLYLPFVVQRLKAYAPAEAKFLVILRNPVDRAYSHWWHNFSWGDEKRSFEDAIVANLKRLETGPFFETESEAEVYRDTLNFQTGFSPYVSYLDSGFYAEQIQRYIDAFGAEKIKILFLDDLKTAPSDVMADVFHFIGLDHRIDLDLSVRNEANSVAGKKLLKIIKQIPGRKIIPARVRSFLYQGIRKNFKGKHHQGEISQELRDWLTSYYEPHIGKLEHMTGKNLAHWLSDKNRPNKPEIGPAR